MDCGIRSPLRLNQATKTLNMRRQRGVTLLELVSSLSVMSVIVVGAISLYASVSATEDAAATQRDLVSLQASINRILLGQGTFNGISPTGSLIDVLVNAKKIPAGISVDTSTTPVTLKNRWGGAVMISGVGTSYTIYLFGIPRDACFYLMVAATGWNSMQTFGGPLRKKIPLPPAMAEADCNAMALGAIVFTGGK